VSLQLTFGGGETLLVRDKGTANAVQGFVSSESVVIKNVTALATTFLFQLIEYVQIVISGVPPSGAIIWIKIAGVWKTTTAFIKVSGVWKTSTPFIKISGTWK
jgi:hypothetical protein